MNLIGKWEKITTSTCGQKYPGTIEFKPNGLYQAEASPDEVVHPIWDVGTFRLEQDTVHLSTSNDAVIAYPFIIEGKTLTIIDSNKCEVQFQII